MNEQHRVTLVLYPNTWGIGYVVCAGPQDILEFGLKQVRRSFVHDYRDKAKWFIDYCRPEIVILLDPMQHDKSSKRINEAITDIKHMVRAHQLKLHEYSRKDIVDVFEQYEAKTKYEIAMQILNNYPQLKSRAPVRRAAWMAEPYQMGVFDAFSLMLTHYYLK